MCPSLSTPALCSREAHRTVQVLRYHCPRYHILSRQVQCDQCGKNFKWCGRLRLHIRSVHRGLIPYFTGKSSVTSVARISSGAVDSGYTFAAYTVDSLPYFTGKFHCVPCDETSENSALLSRHLRCVHVRLTVLSRQVQCDQCGKNFKWCGRLRLHIRSVHRGLSTVFYRQVPLCPL